MDARKLVGPVPNHIVATIIDTDISLYNPQAETVAVLNGTASEIWRLSNGTLTVEGIVSALAETFQADKEVVRPQIERTIQELVDHGYLVLRDPD